MPGKAMLFGLNRLLVLLILPVLAACGGYPAYTTQLPPAAGAEGVTSAPPSSQPVSSAKPEHPAKPAKLKGWQKPYTVFGKRYEPLMSHQGFVEEGVASWYGPDFHGKKTSNGEVYNMHAMTAAHKTLPLGVYVKVRNKANGREAVVRINDRGPFAKGRIIDLSRSAAKDLGVIGPGTAPVRVEALGYKVTDSVGAVSYEAPKSYDVGSYAIQVGAFTVAGNARRLASNLKARYGAASVEAKWVKGRLFHRVRVGRYDSLGAAEGAVAGFEKSGYRSVFVVAME